jgi:thiol-disulfide isomerase/thioredoxin
VEGEDYDGKRFKLSDYRGKVVMVTVWASWCKPCRDLIPHERAIAERFKDARFEIVGINYDNDPARARRAIATDGVTWRNLQTCGDDHPIKKLWPVGALPCTYLIDAQGVVRYCCEGAAIPDQAITALLAETAKRGR